MALPDRVRDRLQEHGVIPVVALARADDAPALAAALESAGLPCAEITFRTPAAAEAIGRIRATHPAVLVGAGTIVSPAEAERAIDAGAQFVVSPGLVADVVAAARARGVPVFPGVMTPTEILRALDAGLTDLKLFPAGPAGGPAFVRALAPVFPTVRFIPTGGIGPRDVAAYLAEPSVLAVGGSWMVRPAILEDRDWAAVRALAADAVAAVAAARSIRPPAGAVAADPAPEPA